MNSEKAKELLDRYNSGELSKQEMYKLQMWYMERSRNADRNLSEDELNDSMLFLEDQLPLAKPKSRKLWVRFAAAASFVLVVGSAVYYYGSNIKNDQATNSFVNDVAPGKNGATLTLASGEKILINDALVGNIASESGVRISKTKDGQLVYEVIDDGASTNGYNILSTTRGEQTQVRLPDGTLVFLNAASSLKYPLNFAQLEKRQVELDGEGYFEVAKDKLHPFIVESAGQKVEVLGTHFNIQAYNEENELKTTLIEGSVKVSGSNANAFKILKPGEQSRFRDNSINVAQVNTENVLAWKEGVFQYDGETLENIMKDVERWYNVKVVYKDESVKREEFYITANRYDKVSGMLKLLEGMKVATFRISGNQIIVDKK